MIMSKYEKFIESLYKMSHEELKEVYKALKNSKDKALQKIAKIMLDYNIVDGVMDIKKLDKINLSRDLSISLSNDFNEVSKLEVIIVDKILVEVVKGTFDFWNYNIEFEDVRKIIENNFKGKHFSARVWDNETEVANKLNSLVNDFLDGKINVNKIKSEMEKTFNNGAYNTKRLAETEVARVEDEAFKRFCREADVKRVKRNAILDKRTCGDCADEDGKVYDLGNAPELPTHPLCRCFYEIVE